MCRKLQKSWADFFKSKVSFYGNRAEHVCQGANSHLLHQTLQSFTIYLCENFATLNRKPTPCSASIKALRIIYITFTSSHIRYYFIRKMTKAFDFIPLRQTTPTHVWAKRKQEFSIKYSPLPLFSRSSRMHCYILDCSLQPSTRHNFFDVVRNPAVLWCMKYNHKFTMLWTRQDVK